MARTDEEHGQGPTGHGDTDFGKLMRPHHQPAIDMPETQLL
jgi:hypothetical protein